MVAVAVMDSAVYGGEYLQEKSMGKALLLSLLLPGTGQQYLGSHRRARTMWVAEGAIWTTYALFTVQGGNRSDKYEEMAQMFAGVDGVRDDAYYQTIYMDDGRRYDSTPAGYRRVLPAPTYFYAARTYTVPAYQGRYGAYWTNVAPTYNYGGYGRTYNYYPTARTCRNCRQ